MRISHTVIVDAAKALLKFVSKNADTIFSEEKLKDNIAMTDAVLQVTLTILEGLDVITRDQV